MKSISIIILISFFTIEVNAHHIVDLPQNEAVKIIQPNQPAQTTSQDSIIFDKLEHDYGTVEKGGDGNAVFTFTNKGQKPLVLSNVRASCGCTIPQWPREPIAPGEQGEIKVKYNTKLGGTFNKSITVNSSAANSMVRLRIKGQVVEPQQ